MTSRRPLHTLALAVTLVAAGLVAPVMPAAQGHHTRPSFEFRFPGEPDLMTFRNDWGLVRPGGRRHRGTDLMAPKMTGVFAFADGVVYWMDTHPRSGRWLRIDHDDEWSTYYIHLNNDNIGTDDNAADWSLTVAPGIEKGAEVKAGQLIGWVGDSGNAEEAKPHLHFELHRNDYSVNPYFTLREAWERDIADLEWLRSFVESQSGAYRRN